MYIYIYIYIYTPHTFEEAKTVVRITSNPFGTSENPNRSICKASGSWAWISSPVSKQKSQSSCWVPEYSLVPKKTDCRDAACLGS